LCHQNHQSLQQDDQGPLEFTTNNGQ
jgi:hypothetical protein